ncbi:MAG TPA: lipid II flippase MurJ [Dehalococcoidia bacterium]|nr:lipid II flippase MurJ [Dehalococcoidia bacterium]
MLATAPANPAPERAAEALELAETEREAASGTRDAAYAGSHRRMVASAGIIGLGNLIGSILGFLRITMLNVLFGPQASGLFVVALRPIQQVSDLIVGGSVSGAFIPTFTDYSAAEKREELRRVYSTVANAVVLLMTLAAVIVFIAAPALVDLETTNAGGDTQQITITLVRIAVLSLYGLGLYAVTSGLLYALREVAFPAFATACYHIGIIVSGVVALALATHALGLPLGTALHTGAASPAAERARLNAVNGLAIGAALGAAGEFLFLVPGLRRVRVSWRPVLDLRHPAVRQIVRLYGPIAAGLIITVLYQNLDVYLTGHTPNDWPANATALQSGTTLIQFPVGLVAAALSFAVLPLLTTAANAGDDAGFKRTLRLGIRLGLLLMVPAMIGLLVLATPIVGMLFQHGACGHGCTVRNTLALQNYAYELPFVALDTLLIAAFFARKNTLIPNVVSIAAIGCYMLVAIPFHGTIGMPALAFADSVKNVSHALILLAILTLTMGSIGLRELANGVGRILAASGAMAVVAWGLVRLLPALSPRLFDLSTARGDALVFLVAGGAASAAYFALLHLLRVEEVHLVAGIVRARLGRHARDV